ncbi:glycosyltransferase family 1 protein [Thalassospira alkalitolerans]|uniref:Glycosyl transferase family 1 domain-containing protein n=1 Tax=Thalassospira alkalitolerans TaxID=1293890 RepID=A0A1Y2LCZ3_9PROT|nr:glycosyltransferase family 1 protein [Thalassospira alkalitolerans]OSQ48362.1 hypothetical protein TALK_08815 [Thalassospira alkalitolerans]
MRGEQKKNMALQIDGALLQSINACRDANKLFELAEYYGKFHWLNTTERWSCPEIENFIFALIAPRLPEFKATGNRKVISHVISEGYDIGGHTPLCVNLMKEQKRLGNDVQLVITRGVTPTVLEDVKASGIPIAAQQSTGVSKLLFLAQTFMQSKAVVLHINPDDIIACLAAMIAERAGIPCYFVNHADIHFSFATSQCSAILEITGASWLASQQFRHPKAQSFLGIPFSTLDGAPQEIRHKDKTQEPYFITVGGPHKYRLGRSPVFTDFVEVLCGELGQKLKMIGPDDYSKFSHLSAKAQNNLELLGTVERTKTLKLMANATAYIDSFPEGGGTSVTNAMHLGLPVFGCKSKAGMYGDDFLSQTPQELFAAIKLFIEHGPDSETLTARARFIKDNFSITACAKRLENTLNGNMETIPYSFDKKAIDLTFYQKKWLETDDFYIPPIIKINMPSSPKA